MIQKKNIIVFAVMAFFMIGLAGCTTKIPSRQASSSADEISGWIVFSGEFLLYQKREDIGKLGDQSCISGIFDDESKSKTAFRRFNNRYVKVTGRLVPETAYFSSTGFGQRAENYCASKEIMIANRIEASVPTDKSTSKAK